MAEPFSTLLTDDVDGDGRVDPHAVGEATVSNLDDFGPLNDVTGLELVGAELSVQVTTTMTGELAVYGILAGEDSDGNNIYLQGRSDLAVSVNDTLLQSFAIGGAPPAPEQMSPRVTVTGPKRSKRYEAAAFSIPSDPPER